jgi:hypothetical protein
MADAVGTWVVKLVVTDARGLESDPDYVIVTVQAPENLPVADAGGDQRVDIGATGGQFADLRVVGGARGQRCLENRGVGGDAHHALGVDEFGKVSRPQSVAGQVVEPDGNARLRQRRKIPVLCHVMSP